MSLAIEEKLIYHSWLGNDKEVGRLLHESLRNRDSNLLINYKSEKYQGNTAVNCAARNGHLKCLSQLCSYQQSNSRIVDLDSLNHQGLAAIHQAALFNHTQCLQLLIVQGCDRHIRSGDGWQSGMTAFDLCGKGVGYADSAALAVLKSYGINGSSTVSTYKDEQLINFALNGDHVEVGALLAQGANINAISMTRGTTALHAAARKGHVRVLHVLLNHHSVRPEVNMYTKGCGYCFTALHLAAANNRRDCVELLLSLSSNNNNDRYSDFDMNIKTGPGWNSNLTALEVCGCMSTYGPSRTTLDVLRASNVAGKIPTHGCMIS